MPVDIGATVATRAAVGAGPALVLRYPRGGCVPEVQVALDIASGTAVQSVENAFPILRTKLVSQFVGGHHTRLGVDFALSEQVSHRLRKIPVLHDASRNPHAWASNRALLPPPSHDDYEVMSAEDRARILSLRGNARRRSFCHVPDAQTAAD